jgi:hypothetical protein
VPADPSGRADRTLGRRTVLAAAAMTFPLLAAGCKDIGGLGTPPAPLPDADVLGEAITAEKLMIARYQAAMSGSPGQAALLAPLLAQHRAHLTRLAARLLDPRPASSTARSLSPAPAMASPAGLSALQAAEEDAANGLVRHLAEVTPSLAQLLASIAASEASHAVALRSRGGIP